MERLHARGHSFTGCAKTATRRLLRKSLATAVGRMGRPGRGDGVIFAMATLSSTIERQRQLKDPRRLRPLCLKCVLLTAILHKAVQIVIFPLQL